MLRKCDKIKNARQLTLDQAQPICFNLFYIYIYIYNPFFFPENISRRIKQCLSFIIPLFTQRTPKMAIKMVSETTNCCSELVILLKKQEMVFLLNNPLFPFDHYKSKGYVFFFLFFPLKWIVDRQILSFDAIIPLNNAGIPQKP
jgi:hypothetical protein